MYYLIILLRNLLFDLGIFKSKSFDVPIISVGNITIGGTGKTPHIEYFIRQFESKKVAVLSRGYKRKTNGFLIADGTASALTIGDEPFQIYSKFPNVIVAVDENRVRGVENLLKLPQKPDIILLDDAFQHRKIKPAEQIVLIDCNRPIFKDRVLPYGLLRESRSGIQRADRVIVTKCPKGFSIKDREFWKAKLNLPQRIDLQFSMFDFYPPKNIFSHKELNINEKYFFLVATGIVSAASLYEYLAGFAQKIEKIEFPDHHSFSQKDILKIEKKFNTLPQDNSYIIVTEKDAARLKSNPHIKSPLKDKIYASEIRVRML